MRPTPAVLTARSATVYKTPLVRPVMTNGLVVPLAAVQVVPPSMEYW